MMASRDESLVRTMTDKSLVESPGRPGISRNAAWPVAILDTRRQYAILYFLGYALGANFRARQRCNSNRPPFYIPGLPTPA
jgi:hypothetical protein